MTNALGQSQVQEQSLPSSGQSQLQPQDSESTSDGVGGNTLVVVYTDVSAPVVVVASSLVVVASRVVFVAPRVVVDGSPTVEEGQTTVPSMIDPFPFLILKLRTNLQPFSAFNLNLFAFATLFLGEQLIVKSLVLRAVSEWTRLKLHLKLVEPTFTDTLENIVLAWKYTGLDFVIPVTVITY